MPKQSERQRLLGDLETVMRCVSFNMLITEQLHSSSSSDDSSSSTTNDSTSSSSSDDELEEYNMYYASWYFCISQHRYLGRSTKTKRSRDYVLHYFLDQTETDFRTITRVSRTTFFHILSLIDMDPVFHNESQNPQHPVHWQLACALDRMGNDGQGVSHARSKLIWGIGQGTVHLYTKRVVHALCNLKGNYIRWPNAAARARISRRMALKGFKGVVGFVDGTTIPIHKKPSNHGNVYMDKKKTYSVNAQIVCDDQYNIIYWMIGYPGSVGDSRVFTGSLLCQRLEAAFSRGEYLLSDSAYAASPTLVPAYKENQRDCRADRDEPAKIEKFNTFLAKARVINEHTIGVLKSRWSSMRGMRIDLNTRKDMRNFIEQATACVVLHNICVHRDPWEDEYLAAEDLAVAHPEGDRAIQASALTPGQKKRWAVRNACLAFHARQ